MAKSNISSLIKRIITHRVFKFAFVGGVGALLQMITANVYALFLTQSISISSLVLSLPDFLAIETSVLSNFIFNNIWTFSDRKLKIKQIPLKFIQFNIASTGSIIIQTIVIGLGLGLIGLMDVFTVPVINMVINSRTIFHATGIIIGMFWNFFAYNKFIWKKKK
jgi:dolichol-phosphate mannosyltransferase